MLLFCLFPQIGKFTADMLLLCNLLSLSRFYRQWLLQLSPPLALAYSEGKISLELVPRILYQRPPHACVSFTLLFYGFLIELHKEQKLKCEDPSQHSPPRVPTFCFLPFSANCFIMCLLKLLCSLGINFVLIFTNRKAFYNIL